MAKKLEIKGPIVKEETPDTMINLLYEVGFVNPITDNAGAIFIADVNNIFTL